MEINSESLEQVLEILGQLLADRGLFYEVVAIEGGSLLLLRQLERTTKDLDLVALMHDGQLVSAHPLPEGLQQAAEEVARALNLSREWLNIGPASLLEGGLPSGFTRRMHTRYFKGLTVHLANRFDQICFKLYASVDQGPKSKHFTDLISLKPTHEELLQAKSWCITQDVSECFASEIEHRLESICAPTS